MSSNNKTLEITTSFFHYYDLENRFILRKIPSWCLFAIIWRNDWSELNTVWELNIKNIREDFIIKFVLFAIMC